MQVRDRVNPRVVLEGFGDLKNLPGFEARIVQAVA
jgi:hypothetical protein